MLSSIQPIHILSTVFLMTVLAMTANAEEIQEKAWYTNLDEAKVVASKSERPIMIVFR